MSTPHTGGGNCPPDEDQIAVHFDSTIGWSAIPYVGPSLLKYADPLPPDGTDDLNYAQGTLQANIEGWRNKITALSIDNAENLNSLMTLLPNYVDTVATLKELPDQQNIDILYVQVISLAIIMMMIILFGIHK